MLRYSATSCPSRLFVLGFRARCISYVGRALLLAGRPGITRWGSRPRPSWDCKEKRARDMISARVLQEWHTKQGTARKRSTGRHVLQHTAASAGSKSSVQRWAHAKQRAPVVNTQQEGAARREGTRRPQGRVAHTQQAGDERRSPHGQHVLTKTACQAGKQQQRGPGGVLAHSFVSCQRPAPAAAQREQHGTKLS